MVQDLESKSKYSDMDLKFEKAFKKNGRKKKKERKTSKDSDEDGENAENADDGEEMDFG